MCAPIPVQWFFYSISISKYNSNYCNSKQKYCNLKNGLLFNFSLRASTDYVTGARGFLIFSGPYLASVPVSRLYF